MTNYQTLAANNVRIKAWTNGVQFEPEAEAQLRRIAALPFVHKWSAVMPDVHAGIGATVGSVIATKRAVIPAAVGVDIGCFTGDTRIPLLNGTVATLRDLAVQGREHWVYAIGADQRVPGALATALKTRTN